MADNKPKKKKSTKKAENSTTTAISTDVKPKKKVPGRPFKKGQSGNPAGRPVGARDRRTVIWEAMKVLAENAKHLKFKGMDISTPEDVEVAMQMAALMKAISRGDYYMYQELSNGLYGKITDNMDIKSGGKSLADLIATANAGRGRKRTQAAKQDTE